MANLDSGTFLRLIALDSQNQKGALELPIKAFTLPTGVQAAIDALGAAQYGSGKPCISPYIGSEVIIGSDGGILIGNGDIANVWKMNAYATVSGESLTFSIPGRDTEDPSLLVPGSEIVANLSQASWVAWLAALAATDLLAPSDSTGTAMGIQGGLATARARVRPREEIRRPTPPHVIGGTRLRLWCLDTALVKDYSQTLMAPIAVPSGMITQIDALGTATFNSVPVSGPITPALAVYAGWELIVRLDNGYTGGGAGDVRDKWQMKAVGAVNLDLRWGLPGRNTLVPGLIIPGTKRLANLSNSAWAAWIAAMTNALILAPQDDAGQAEIIGGISNVRPRAKPRVSISSGGT